MDPDRFEKVGAVADELLYPGALVLKAAGLGAAVNNMQAVLSMLTLV